MKPKPSNAKSPVKAPAERVVKDIRRATRRHFSTEDKIRIVLEGLRGDDKQAGSCVTDAAKGGVTSRLEIRLEFGL
jgi:transposase